jgi:hypothetical protein
MAHECPDCGLICHCNGDIDDLLLNFEKDVNKCCHCDILKKDDDDEYIDLLTLN